LWALFPEFEDDAHQSISNFFKGAHASRMNTAAISGDVVGDETVRLFNFITIGTEFVKIFLSQMTEIQLVVLLVPVGNT